MQNKGYTLKIKPEKPTKEQFELYVEIQMSGITNMLDIDAVIYLSGNNLTKENLFYIYKNYSDLYNEYIEEKF